MPHLKALVERYEDQPFAIVGVNCHDSEEDYRKGVKEYEVTWKSAFEGKDGGPIAALWGVQGFPTMHVIDAEGVIRGLGLRGPSVDKLIEELVAEATAKQKQGAER